MASMYLVMKRYQRAFGIADDHVHEVWPTRKEANAATGKLNKQAQYYTYFVKAVKVGKL